VWYLVVSDARAPVICLDGPSGSGKGTVGRMLARQLNWHFLDSGALYRLVAVAARQAGVNLEAAESLAALATALNVEFSWNEQGQERIVLAGQEVTAAVRAETTGADASRVAAYPAVREALLARQQASRRAPGLIADGRDMGTVVFPDAPLKIFLTASAEERARRRHKQLMEHGIEASITSLIKEIESRDRQDRERSIAPLKPAPDALTIDSTGRLPEHLCQEIIVLGQARNLY
jgi:cytidylate kinase